MNILVYDTSAGRTKNWDNLLGRSFQFVDLTISHNKPVCTSVGHSSVNLLNAIILLHGPRSHDDAVVNTASALTNESPTLSAVVVSGGGLASQKSLGKVYFRRTPVSKEDSGFRRCFEAFIIDLEKSHGATPHFDLLEPTAVPSLLLAYALAVQYRLNPPNIQDLSASADVCYGQIQAYAQSLLGEPEKGPISFPEVRVPSRTVFESETPGDPCGVRFKAMRNVIELLREDL